MIGRRRRRRRLRELRRMLDVDRRAATARAERAEAQADELRAALSDARLELLRQTVELDAVRGELGRMRPGEVERELARFRDTNPTN